MERSSASADLIAETRQKRPFWMHQIAEYLLGGVLVAQGLQSPTPLMPAVAGGLIMANAAVVRGPLSAFGLVARATHRILDVVVIVAIVAAAGQPWVSVEASSRVIMVVLAGVMAFVWWQSSFAEKVRTRAPIPAEGARSTEIGRMAGRVVGDGVITVRRWKNARKR